MWSSRTLIRITAMAVLAVGPTAAAIFAPPAPSRQPQPPAASSVLLAPGSKPLPAPGPVRLSPRKPVAQKATPAASPAPPRPTPGKAPPASFPNPPVVQPLPETATGHSGPASRWIVHHVRDGDSLERLAAKYLGDPARAEEILLWNCDRIDDPAMLPLGVELLIPRPGL